MIREDNYGITKTDPNHYRDLESGAGEQIARLFIIKALYQGGAYQEATPEYKRLAFVRWLYQQGRLQS